MSFRNREANWLIANVKTLPVTLFVVFDKSMKVLAAVRSWTTLAGLVKDLGTMTLKHRGTRVTGTDSFYCTSGLI